MISGWANSDLSLSAFDGLQSGLTVALIATPRKYLKTCLSTDPVSKVLLANRDDQFDYLPVIRVGEPDRDAIVGMFHAGEYRRRTGQEPVATHMEILSEHHLIGADTSIIDFIVEADARPSRLVVSGDGFSGLVTVSDLQKLPVRAALFAAITSFEMTMSQFIRRRFAGTNAWKELLSVGRRTKIEDEIERSRRADGLADELLFTQFCDKGTILLKSVELAQSRRALEERLTKLQDLRDSLAHANDYAATPEAAKGVCALVRALLALRVEVANAGGGSLNE